MKMTRKGTVSGSRNIGMIIVLSFVLLAMTLPISAGVVSAGVTGTYLHVVEDNDYSQTRTYSEVRHKFRSWYYRQQYQEDQDFRISLFYIEKRHTGYGSWGRSALAYAYLRQRSYNVDIAYVPNGKVGNVGYNGKTKLYHYAPLDGSSDGSNGVGTLYPTRYLVVKYDLPPDFKNFVYRSGGTYLSNTASTYKSSQPWVRASQWQWVPAANAAHFDPGSGYEIRGYTASDSWSAQWDWGCFCYKVRHYWDSGRWYFNY
jgi:hypothetical protein